MPSSDDAKLLNDLDMKDLFERHSDARAIETMSLSVLALVGSVAVLVLSNGSFGVRSLSTSLALGMLGFFAATFGRIFRLRVVWLQQRAGAATQRLCERNKLPSYYASIGGHAAFDEGVLYTFQSDTLRARLRIKSFLSPVNLLESVGNALMLMAMLLALLNITAMIVVG